MRRLRETWAFFNRGAAASIARVERASGSSEKNKQNNDQYKQTDADIHFELLLVVVERI